MTQIDKNPWLGLKAYDEGTILYGRNEDTINLAQLVFYNTDAVLYGKSGIGKSSLLNANLLPRARRRGIEPIFIRLDHHENVDSYVTQIINAIKNAGIAIEKKFDTSSDTPLLWELFHCYEFFKGNKRTPLLIIFDQFEEIFTLQQNQEKRLAFFKEMADFINDIKPRQLTQENPKAEKDEENNPILNFDELNIDDINLQIPEEYQKNYVDDNEIHLLISLREDFLPEFEYHTTAIPSLKQHRYGLRPVTDKEAREIITMPGRNCLPADKEEREKLVAGIINFSKEGDLKQINTLLLSLTCYLLYQKAQKRGSERLSLQDFEQMGSNLLLEFYESLNLDKKTQAVLEQRLIDSNGRRNTINKEEITALLPDWEELTKGDKRILQVNTNNRIELVHDMLASAIYKTREHRQKKNKGRILKVYLLALLAVFFIVGILGSVFTLKEDDLYQRIPINPTKSIIWPKNEQCELNDSKYKYIENLYYEGGPAIFIFNHPNLKRIKISGNCSYVRLNNCPQLRHVEFEDSISVGFLSIERCPNLKQIYLPYIYLISSDTDIRFIPNANDHSLINHNGTLWDIDKREIKYIANSKITNSFKTNGKVYEDFPRQMYNWRGLIKDSVKYSDIWIYSSDLEGKNRDYVKNGLIMRDPDIEKSTVLGYKDEYNTFNLSSLHIADKAFEGCKDLESIIIDDNTSFGTSPFVGCSNLKSIIIQQDNYGFTSLDDIISLFSALQDVPNDITYDIRGNGSLNKREDGVITYDDIPVLISNESKKTFDIKRRNDTTYICTRGWFYLEREKPKIVRSYGFPNIEDTRAIQDSTIWLEETEDFLDAKTRIYLKDTFTDGKIPTYIDYKIKVLCKNLSAKQRLWRINYPNVKFSQLADSVKKEITIIVPYGKLNEFYNNDEFIGFKDIQEASFVQTFYNNMQDTIMNGALGYLLGKPIILSILIMAIAVVMLLCWHLSTKRIKTSTNPSHAMLKGLVEALAMIILAFVAWLAFYWLAWFWGPDFISTRTPVPTPQRYYNTILSNISGIIAALVVIFLMYKNALYLLKTLKFKTIRHIAITFFSQHKKSLVCILAIIAICIISVVSYQNRQEKIAVANHLLEVIETDLNSDNDERKKAAFFVISNYLKDNKAPTKAIEDEMYALLDTLAFETGYNMKLLHKEKNKAHSLTLSPDGTKLATGCEDGIINIYDTANGQFIKTIDCDDWANLNYCKWIDDRTLIAKGWNVYCINMNDSTITEENIGSYDKIIITGQNFCYTPWRQDSILVVHPVINGQFIKPDTIHNQGVGISSICTYNGNILIGSSDGTVKMYNPQSKNLSLLYNANFRIQAIGSNDSIIAFSTSDSLYIMRHNGDKQDIKRHDIKYINSIHLSRINNIIVINKNQVATIDASLNLKNINYLNANRIKQIIPTADGECLYVVDDDNNIRYMKTEKPSKEELLETVIRNFQLENYELTEGELIKYKLYN